MSEGGLAQFSTSSFSSASSPAYTESSGFYYPYYGGAVMTKAGQLTVTL